MQTPANQRGLSLIVILMILVLLGFFLLLGVRLAPVYLDYWTIVSVAESIEEDGDLENGSIGEVRQSISSRMTVNNLRGYDADIYTVGRAEGGGLEIRIAYEKRIPFVANVDLVAVFERTVGP